MVMFAEQIETKIASDGTVTVKLVSDEQTIRDNGKVSGAWVFRGTRMPVATVFENLEAGATIEDIME